MSLSDVSLAFTSGLMKNLLLLLTFLAANSVLSAQPFEKVSINTGFDAPRGKIIAADLNNDGVPEGIVSSLSGLSIFTYTSGTFVRQDYPDLGFRSSHSSLDVGDVDRNGYIDILHSGSNYSNYTLPTPTLLLNTNLTLTPTTAGLISQENGALYLGDFEGDGDLDVLTPGHVLLNRDNILQDSGPYFHDLGTWYAHWWDLDGDSELEVLRTNGLPGSGWVSGTQFLERQSPAMAPSAQFTFDGIQMRDALVADYDADGDLDLLSSYFNENSNGPGIFKNENGRFVNAHIGFAGGSSYVLADMNNDGLYDVVAGGMSTGMGSYYTTTYIYLQQPDGFFNIVNTGTALSEDGNATVVDFDGDGDLDILSLGGAYRNNTTQVNVAPGAPAGPVHHVSGSSVKLSWQPGSDDNTPLNSLTYNIAVRSEDGTIIVPAHALANGRRQLYRLGNAWNNLSFNVSCLKAGTYYWKVQTIDASYQGSAFSAEQSFTIEQEPPTAPVNLTATAVADRAIDLRWTDASVSEDEFIIFRTNPDFPPDFYAIDTVAANVTYYRDSIYLEPDKTYLYRVVASNCAYPDTFGAEALPVTTFRRAFVGAGWMERSFTTGTFVLLGDYDRDEDLDMVVTTSSPESQKQTRLFRFTGATYEDTGILFNTARGGRWIDYNNDGYLDLLLYSEEAFSASKPALYKNEQGISFSLITENLLPNADPMAGISLGDYDNDGDEDALVQTAFSWDVPTSIHLYDNDGTGSFTENATIDLAGYLDSQQAWADYDRDGDLDIITCQQGACETDRVILYENNGDGTFRAIPLAGVQSPAIGSYNYGALEWGDYDNDGYPDLVIAGQNQCEGNYSSHYVYHNNRDKTFTRVSTLVQLAYDINVAWGDYDNDGDADLFAYGDPFAAYSERTRVYRNDGGKFKETDIDYLLESTQYGEAARGDIDRDGDLDYVILGESTYTNQKVIAYKNTYAESWGRKNLSPTAPQHLQSITPAPRSATFSWSAAEDALTASSGLTYNLYLIHEDGSVVMNCYALNNGVRLVVAPGNVLGTTLTLKHLKPGNYRWSVQALDQSFEGSAFSEEHTFLIGPEPEEPEEPEQPVTGVDEAFLAGLQVYPNPVSDHLTVLSRPPSGIIQLYLMNSVGESVGSITLDAPEVTYDMATLPAGLYIAAIYHNGTRIGAKKVLKQ